MMLFLSLGCYRFLWSPVPLFFTYETSSRSLRLLLSLKSEIGLAAVFDLMKYLEAKNVADWLLILEILFRKEDKDC